MPFSGYQDLRPDFAQNLQRYIAANPGLEPFSGFRSIERQRQLWEASDKSGRMVARPGHSYHNFREAVDLRYNGQAIKSLPAEKIRALHASAGEFGLKYPMSWEPWHIEPMDTRGGSKPQTEITGNVPPTPTSTSIIDSLNVLPPGPEDSAVSAYQRALPGDPGFGGQELMQGIIGGTLRQDMRSAMFKRLAGMFF